MFKTYSFLGKPSVLGAYFSTRSGGVSQKPYDDLNLGYHTGDLKESVDENYKRLKDALALGENWVYANQVHGTNVICVEGLQTGCLGSGDALMTDVKGVVLTTMHADCTPLYVYDPVKHVIGLAHAGWQGTLNKMSAVLIKAMQKRYGCQVSDLRVVIGPCITYEAYEVDDALALRFQALFGPDVVAVKGMRMHLNLKKAHKLTLIDLGLNEDQVHEVADCTYTDQDLYFSHRREGHMTGRMLAVMTLKRDKD